MPLPSASLLPAAMDREAVEDAAAEASAAAGLEEGERAEDEEGGIGLSRSPPQAGVSFAAMARDGFAATGPVLGAGAAPGAAAPSRGAWGSKIAAAPAPAASAWGPSVGSAAAGRSPDAPAAMAAQQLGGMQLGGGKSKKGKILLLGAPQRKY